MSTAFSEVVASHLKTEKRMDAEQIGTLLQTYVAFQSRIPGMPSPTDADVTDIIAFGYRNIRQDDETWTEFKTRAIAEYMEEVAQNDIFQPVWAGKTDERPTPWLIDTAAAPIGSTTVTINKTTRDELAKALRYASPAMSAGTTQRLGPPTRNFTALEQVLRCMCNTSSQFIWQLGTGDNPAWRWGPSLCLLGGLGLNAVRYMASHLEDNEGWSHFLSLNDDELAEELVAARNTCGYPVGLLRADFKDVYRAIANEAVPPRWFKTVVAMHIAKHCRLVRSYRDDNPAMFVAYNGRFSFVAYTKEGHTQPILCPANKNLAAALRPLLGLPNNVGRNRTGFDLATDTVLQNINVCNLVYREDLRMRPELVVPAGVHIAADPHVGREHRFIDPGVAVFNCARVDLDTGAITRSATITGDDVMTYDWPRNEITKEDLDMWRFNLPDKVPAMRASEVVFTFQKNANFLGERKGALALFDAMVAVGLVRDLLSGSSVGAMVRKEFPLTFVYPTGSTRDDTTNQGKTNLCRMVARIFVPDLPEPMAMNRSDSAPVQRSLAQPIDKYGTAIYDEYIMPYSKTHVLGKEQLQALATGGFSAPGEAMGNSPGVKLRYPLFFTAKVSSVPPDIRNRQMPIFLDAITDATRLDDDMLALIGSGRVSAMARLSMLCYMQKHGIIDKIREATPVGGKDSWRFTGHMAAALIFADGDLGCIQRYLAKAEAQCDKQLGEADNSGLVDELGVNASFELDYYWEQAQSMTLESVHLSSSMAEKSGTGLGVLEVARALIEDGSTRRSFDGTLRQYQMREKTLLAKCIERLKKGPLTRGEWTLRILRADEVKEAEAGPRRLLCRVDRIKQPAPDAQPAPTK